MPLPVHPPHVADQLTTEVPALELRVEAQGPGLRMSTGAPIAARDLLAVAQPEPRASARTAGIGSRRALAAASTGTGTGTESDAATAAKVEELRTLVRGGDEGGHAAERRILELFEQASSAELNAMVKGVELRQLFDVVEDHFLHGQNKKSLLQLLSVKRLAELSVDNRARIIDELQIGHTGGLAEQTIRNIFLGTTGEDLTALKNAIDNGGDYHDLAQLLVHDIDDDKLRAEILRHIEREAMKVPTSELKVMSDIDDTLYPNWKDKSFPEKTPYPGVRQFYRELDRGPDDGRMGDLVFLTARPGDRAGVVENMTHATLQSFGLTATVLAGDLASSATNRDIATKKVENFSLYRQLYPEYKVVFVGDSGQGDVMAGEEMLRAAPGAVRCVFIHDVMGTPLDKREAYRRAGVFFFDSYVDAAAEAFRRGHISREGLERVVASAQEEIAKVQWDSDAQRQARLAELREAVRRASVAAQ